MLAKPILLIGLAGHAFAGFAIETTTLEIPVPTNDAEASKLLAKASQLSSEGESLASSISDDPKYTSFWSVVDAFVATRTDVPPEVTQSTAIFDYTTAPDWYKALPTDAQQYYQGLQEAQYSIYHKVMDGAAGRPMARPTGVAGHMGGVVVAAAAVGAAVLM
ncbi:hypothetical protein BDV96DRAFT_312508 [Lophiotrema nucula]|uniref:Uncharacterized protein n=1 Tax=Lophiotrema nucula TaxID=690887 RepID=A0A6A5ZJT2_9PLEO|nr:hypothetical protein BDV96DRAFT_312508 [Lophiotrema nucula]